jgi:3-oxoacyl-[acyl-carrier-protein] synthase-3
VPHQANLRIIEGIARKIGAPQALSRMIERGEIGSGDAVLLLGFGAGISYAAQVITVP